jgi:SAM-dependent methyltransferase
VTFALERSMRDAYDAASAVWGDGPQIVYGRLAAALVAGEELGGRSVLDLGAGTGAVSAVVAARGGVPVALDAALGMARTTRATGLPSVAAVASGLPFAERSFDVVIAAFLLNHVADPLQTIGEVWRVLAPGGRFLATTFADGPEHPVKAAVDEAARARGWHPPAWYERFKCDLAGRVADASEVRAMARRAGFVRVEAVSRPVDLGTVAPERLVEYRLGMASLAGFAAELTPPERASLVADAVARMGPAPEPLRPVVVFLSAVAPGRR